MNHHLLLITIGPVQDFIVQARRTRDLWFGSILLSELSRKVAASLALSGAELIFPDLKKDDPELENCLEPVRPKSKKPPLNVANKILAELPEGVDPRQLAMRARERLLAYWKDIAADVRQRSGGLLATDSQIEQIWTEQIETFIEFTATWTLLRDYGDARKQVEGAIASRKNLREFAPWRCHRPGAPKSSLDGARDTVLAEPDKRHPNLVHRFRIAPAEQLDAVGLVKRTGGKPEQFVPVANIALASWINLAAREVPEKLDELKETCRVLNLAPVLRDLPVARSFPFDASILMPSRWRAIFKEQGLQADGLKWEEKVRHVIKSMNEPLPYVACLVADGDGMGRALNRFDDAEPHRTFSRELAKFAGKAREIVEQNHLGSLVYSGGDDVLAFLPLPEVLNCADDLRKCFAGAMQGACSSLPEAERPTLSVGVGIGHVMEGMGDLLKLGRDAEKLAKSAHLSEPKRDRNAIAIIVDKRSGGLRSWRAQWTEWNGDPIARLRQDTRILEDRLSTRKIYEIANTLDRLPQPSTATTHLDWARMLRLEVLRSLSRADGLTIASQPLPFDQTCKDLGLSLSELASYASLHDEVKLWVDRILIAAHIAKAAPSKRGSAREIAA
jgi:CRISPR-associated protein Cmr2